jgi:hypothetical protein
MYPLEELGLQKVSASIFEKHPHVRNSIAYLQISASQK